MTDQCDEQQQDNTDETVTQERRDFLRGLGKWSQAVIGGVLLGGAVTLAPQARAGAWINRRGGYGGGGGGQGGGGGGGAGRGGGGGGGAPAGGGGAAGSPAVGVMEAVGSTAGSQIPTTSRNS